MKITNAANGIQYDMDPDTVIDMERPNPFFSEYGEQSLPLTLPDSDHNRAALGYPDLLGNRNKASIRVPITIEDGEYFVNGRQAVLGAERREGITTSFYINEGSFYDKMADTTLRQVFEGQKVEGLSSVDDCIAFLRQLRDGQDSRLAIFPIHIKDGSSEGLKQVNRVEWLDTDGYYLPQYEGGSLRFYNEFPRKEKVGDQTIDLPAGFYLSPFIRVRYLLECVFRHFGYTFVDTDFTRSSFFSSLCFLNNTIDAIVNGYISFSQLVPDCSCADILDVFRKRFCCEFIPDEVHNTVTIRLFNDVLASRASVDLSAGLVGHPKIDYPEKYQRVSLSSSDRYTDGSADTFDSIADLLDKYPYAYYDPVDGGYYRIGYCISPSGYRTWKKMELITASYLPYQDDDDDNYEKKEISVPDAAVSFTTVAVTRTRADGRITRDLPLQCLFAGQMRTLNSSIKMYASIETDLDIKTETEALKPMLALAFSEEGYTKGTVTSRNTSGDRLWDYSLEYNGPDGIFARFYRRYDTLLRNSFHTVTAKLLLTGYQKKTLSSFEKVVIDSQELMPSNIKFSIGSKYTPEDSEFVTIRIYQPVDVTPDSSFIVPDHKYMWYFDMDLQRVTKQEYEKSPYKDKVINTVLFPPPPTEEQYTAGGHYYEQKTCTDDFDGSTQTYNLRTFYLTPVLPYD